MTKWFSALTLLLVFGCSGPDTKPDATPAPVVDEGPTAEEIAECPCGPEDWSGLPPGGAPEEKPEEKPEDVAP